MIWNVGQYLIMVLWLIKFIWHEIWFFVTFLIVPDFDAVIDADDYHVVLNFKISIFVSLNMQKHCVYRFLVVWVVFLHNYLFKVSNLSHMNNLSFASRFFIKFKSYAHNLWVNKSFIILTFKFIPVLRRFLQSAITK